MTGSKEDSEDAVQNAFLNAVKSFDKFKNNSSVYTWLYRILLNECKKYKRDEFRLPVDIYAEENNLTIEQVYNYINKFGITEDEVLIEDVKKSCLQMFMNCMPQNFRAVFTLRKVLKFTVSETADILQIKESLVKIRLHRAVKIMKDHLSGRCSLVKPGNKCECRYFAAYLKETGRTDQIPEISVIYYNEDQSSTKFKNDIKRVFEIDELYSSKVNPVGYNEMLDRVKSIIKDNDYAIF